MWPGWRDEGGSGGGLFFHAVAGAFDHDGFGVMEEPVEHCGGQGAVVIEDRGPLLEGFIGGQHDGTAFVPGADDLKEQIGALLVDRQIAHLIEHKQAWDDILFEFGF